MSSAVAPSGDRLVREEPVELRDVEAALLTLRREIRCEIEPDRDDAQAINQPITRACMSNLIVYCDDANEADGLTDELASLARVHPARVIVLVADAGRAPDRPLARIRAGLTDHGRRRQVSSEQIRIDVPGDDPNRVASAARPLLIGDLPTALWWNAQSPPSQAGSLFEELRMMAPSVIYDSRGWRDPARGLLSVANWVLESKRPPLVADLAWMRQRGWRGLFAETLAPHLLPGALQNITSMRLEHGPHGLPLVSLFVGWFAHALGWTADSARLSSERSLNASFTTPSGPVQVEIVRRDQGSADLQRADLTTTRGADPVEIQFEALSQERVAIRVGDGAHGENLLHLPSEPRIACLAWQLANRAGDPAFHGALHHARGLAREIVR